MDTRLTLAWLHLLALGVGLAAVWARARALRGTIRAPDDHGAVRRVLMADAWWGIAAATWIVTGLWRLFAGSEKSMSWYFGNQAFVLKMGLVVVIIALEIWPMTMLLRWRRNGDGRAGGAGRIEAISYVQLLLVIATVLAASAMARGYGSAQGLDVGPTTPGSSVHAPAGTDSVTSPVAGADAAGAAAAALPAIVPIEPTGVETVTAADLALLTASIGMPLDGVDPLALQSSYDDARGGGTRQHRALDIMAPRGTPVRSATKGRVLKLFTSVAGGLMVYAADSSERFILMYAHLDAYAPGLRDGAALSKGQVIGTVGFTGNASPSAPHLHLAVARSADVRNWSKGMPIDPLPVLQAAARQRP